MAHEPPDGAKDNRPACIRSLRVQAGLSRWNRERLSASYFAALRFEATFRAPAFLGERLALDALGFLAPCAFGERFVAFLGDFFFAALLVVAISVAPHTGTRLTCSLFPLGTLRGRPLERSGH